MIKACNMSIPVISAELEADGRPLNTVVNPCCDSGKFRV